MRQVTPVLKLRIIAILATVLLTASCANPGKADELTARSVKLRADLESALSLPLADRREPLLNAALGLAALGVREVLELPDGSRATNTSEDYFVGAQAVLEYLDETDPQYTDVALANVVFWPAFRHQTGVEGWAGYDERVVDMALKVVDTSTSKVIQVQGLAAAAKLVLDHDWQRACEYATRAHEIEVDWNSQDKSEIRSMDKAWRFLTDTFDDRMLDAIREIRQYAIDRTCPISSDDFQTLAQGTTPALSQMLPFVLDSIPGIRIEKCKDIDGAQLRIRRLFWEDYWTGEGTSSQPKTPWSIRTIERYASLK